MRRVFKTKHFNRWMRKTELTDRSLCRAVSEVATRKSDRWFFVFGFEKSVRSNINSESEPTSEQQNLSGDLP